MIKPINLGAPAQVVHTSRREAADAELAASLQEMQAAPEHLPIWLAAAAKSIPPDPEPTTGWLESACGTQVPGHHLNGSVPLAPPHQNEEQRTRNEEPFPTLAKRLTDFLNQLGCDAAAYRRMGLLESEGRLLKVQADLYRLMAGHVPEGWPGFEALCLWAGRELADAEVQVAMPLDPTEKRRAEGKLELLHKLLSLLTTGDLQEPL